MAAAAALQLEPIDIKLIVLGDVMRSSSSGKTKIERAVARKMANDRVQAQVVGVARTDTFLPTVIYSFLGEPSRQFQRKETVIDFNGETRTTRVIGEAEPCEIARRNREFNEVFHEFAYPAKVKAEIKAEAKPRLPHEISESNTAKLVDMIARLEAVTKKSQLSDMVARMREDLSDERPNEETLRAMAEHELGRAERRARYLAEHGGA